jgi:hypothetical protein
VSESLNQIKVAQEILLLAALLISTLLYFIPLNAWLCGFRWKASLPLLKWNFTGALISWCVYRLFRPLVEESGRTGLLITGLVILNAILCYSWIRYFNVHEKTLREDRIGGWILFSPVLMIAVVISTPLFGALMTSFISFH